MSYQLHVHVFQMFPPSVIFLSFFTVFAFSTNEVFFFRMAKYPQLFHLFHAYLGTATGDEF